jgi:stearoyl-CoA desaturase (delta-9 desaturase)
MRNIVKGPFRMQLTLGLFVVHAVTIVGVVLVPPSRVSLAVWVAAAAMYVVSSLGITTGYHRYFTHGAFDCTEGAKKLLAFMGALAAEGPLTQWVADHRQHHAYTDDEGDPHSPLLYAQPLGFIWAHVGWLFWETKRPGGYRPMNVPKDDAVIRWQHQWYWIIVVLGFTIPTILFGVSGLVWVGFVRMVLHLHVTWAVNSVCHLWGSRPEPLRDASFSVGEARNNVLIAVLGTGEGWHGNHHVKPNAADLGRDHWYDPGYWLIRTFVYCGLAWDVKTFARS